MNLIVGAGYAVIGLTLVFSLLVCALVHPLQRLDYRLP